MANYHWKFRHDQKPFRAHVAIAADALKLHRQKELPEWLEDGHAVFKPDRVELDCNGVNKIAWIHSDNIIVRYIDTGRFDLWKPEIFHTVFEEVN